MLVLDIDPAGIERIKNYEIPDTWTVLTPRGGYHYYFKWPKELNNVSTTKVAVLGEGSGVDVRGIGGFVVAPPSCGGSNIHYRWANAKSYRDVGLAYAPKWLIDELVKPLEQNGYTPVTSNWIEELLDGVSDGERHAALVKLAGYYFARMHPDLAEIHLRHWNEKNNPPIDEPELTNQIDDIRQRFKRGEYESLTSEDAGGVTLSAADLMKYDKEHDWLIDDFIPMKGLTLMSGEPEAGKTWFALDFAIEAARGGKWLGQFPIKKSRVFYVDEERPIEFIRKRYLRLLREKKLSSEILDLNFSFQMGYKLDILEKRERFIQQIKDIRPDVIILDAFADFHSREENNSTEVMQVYEVLKRVRNEFGCSILIIDHDRKALIGLDGKPIINPDSVGNQNRGSNAKRGAVETQLTIKVVDGMHRIYHSKASWGTRREPFFVSIIDPAPGQTKLEFKGGFL